MCILIGLVYIDLVSNGHSSETSGARSKGILRCTPRNKLPMMLYHMYLSYGLHQVMILTRTNGPFLLHVDFTTEPKDSSPSGSPYQ